jgi:hypothetical protein
VLPNREIFHEGAVLQEFGTTQCLAIFLDGLSLPAGLHSALDFSDVVTRLGSAAGDDSYHGYWQGPQETGLFFFGRDADEMFTRTEPVLAVLPIGQNARVVIRHGKSGVPISLRSLLRAAAASARFPLRTRRLARAREGLRARTDAAAS